MAIDLIVLGSREFDHEYFIRLSVCYLQGPREMQTLRVEEDFFFPLYDTSKSIVCEGHQWLLW
jgi:hypothetical protein